MSKFLLKIAIASIAIAATAVGTFYLTSASGDSNTASSNNLKMENGNTSKATLVNVWDKETD